MGQIFKEGGDDGGEGDVALGGPDASAGIGAGREGDGEVFGFPFHDAAPQEDKRGWRTAQTGRRRAGGPATPPVDARLSDYALLR